MKMKTRCNHFVIKGIVLLFNLTNAVKIENLIIPDLVQIGNTTEIILDCQFSEVGNERLTVRWFHNNSKKPLYEWTPNTQPKVSGILSGRLDLMFRISSSYHDEGRALRILRLSPELSGEYTCSVECNGAKVQQTKPMLVFSPEQEFHLNVKKEKIKQQTQKMYEVQCIVRGVFPLPELIIKYENNLIKQQQRVWRSDGDMSLYDAESTARFAVDCHGTVTCRLVIPEAGYTALKERVIYTYLGQCSNLASTDKLIGPFYAFLWSFVNLHMHYKLR